ncbi:hypothetical protein CROQUDRAFT_669008 [Cronartium quercuum f. sp. fusiforme G11]|uniref:Uncharacterized protein n=1 Tax=Cronartium quercuum f. sp. fusiforme G11 TaxID=708437 RepID=A0A9P6NSW4_9BASI|nr:hypothetical protein CROQUDRAFT_669008 [Cronartium quercuum f. sp. fusiforme G11]
MKKPREELISLRIASEDKFKRINKMKDLNSKRIVPDSDSESSRDESSESEEDDSEDESTCDSRSSSGGSSMTDADFIVNDMTDERKANKIQRDLELQLPAEFRSKAHDYLPHFKLVCQYLVLSIFLPHTN